MSLPLAALLEGKYEILDKIGEGGIGSIYKVRHQLLDEIRVIKVLRAQVAGRDDLQQRLMKEAQTAIRLTHPNIARLHDLAVAGDGTAYIVMEFIDGVSIDSLLAATGPPSLDLSLEIAKQALKAIGFLHDEGFIHRDISPDNLMLTRDFKGGVRVKLIDLGIAKDITQTSGVTAAGTFLGKVKYCPPELFRDPEGVTQLDQRSDNYSFGVTLYELLTGEYPFKGESFEELAAGHLFHPPRSFDETDPENRVPEALRAIVMGALAKDPEGRPASADEFIASLDQFEIREEELKSELERTVDATARFLSKFEKYSAAGSTQDHLNEQFGMEKTGAELPAADEAPVAASPVHATPHPEAADRSRRRPSRVLLAAVLVAVLGGLGFWIASRGAGPSTADPAEIAIPIVPVERWSSDSTTDLVDAALMDGVEDGGPPGTAEPEPWAGDPRLKPPPHDRPGQPPFRPGPGDPLPGSPAGAGAGEAPPAGPPPGPPPGAGGVRLLKPGPGVVIPRSLEVLEPSYPKPDKREVVVSISALVGPDGRVLAATVKKGPSFKRRFREAALAAVKAAAFEPATENGVPGKMWVNVNVRFRP